MANYIPKLVYNSITLSFSYPPSKDDFENLEPKRVVATSVNGTQQVLFQYTEIIRKLTFKFLTQAQHDALQTFFTSWAIAGNTFDYYDTASIASFNTYSLKDDKFNSKKVAYDSGFLYEISFTFRRV